MLCSIFSAVTVQSCVQFAHNTSQNEMTKPESDILPVDWKRRVNDLKGATYLTLDDAVGNLVDTLIEDIGVSEKDIESRRAFLMEVYGNAGLLSFIMNSLDIREC